MKSYQEIEKIVKDKSVEENLNLSYEVFDKKIENSVMNMILNDNPLCTVMFFAPDFGYNLLEEKYEFETCIGLISKVLSERLSKNGFKYFDVKVHEDSDRIFVTIYKNVFSKFIMRFGSLITSRVFSILIFTCLVGILLTLCVSI